MSTSTSSITPDVVSENNGDISDEDEEDRQEFNESHLSACTDWAPDASFQWTISEVLGTCPVIWATIQIILIKGSAINGDATSNSCESFHNLIIPARSLPFPLCVFEVANICLRQIHQLRTRVFELGPDVHLSQPFQDDLLSRFEKSKMYSVSEKNGYSPQKSNLDDKIIGFHCSKTPNLIETLQKVDLAARSCSCEYWQNSQLPCVHVLVAVRLRLIKINECVAKYLSVSHLRDFFNNYQIPTSVSPDEIKNLLESPGLSQSMKLPPLPKKTGRPKNKRIPSSWECNSSNKKSRSTEKKIRAKRKDFGGKHARRKPKQ